MTGRGVDQILPHPGDPCLQEPAVRSATTYVELAERAHGPIPRPVDFAYIWGDALEELAHPRAGARVVNLETGITRSDDVWKGKTVTYRMHPNNVPCLTAAHIDCCVLANNHVLDYGPAGLLETLETLRAVGVRSAGAGRNLAEAQAPAVIDVPGPGRVIVLGFGTETSGIPRSWAATEHRPGINLLEDLSDETVDGIASMIGDVKRPGDVVVASIHWGGNWGFNVPHEHVRFAHGLLRSGVDIVHGHSSHHVRPIEVFEGKLVLYGCGDFLDDYEGLDSYVGFRDDLTLMYFPTVDVSTGRLADLHMTPMTIRRFKVHRASLGDARWLRDTINRESRKLGFQVELSQGRGLELRHVRGSDASGEVPPPGAAAAKRRLNVRVRLLGEPCLWCWEIVDEVSGDEIESSWDTEWCGYPTREEAETAGRGRLGAITGASATEALSVAG
jgi:poly-gamma-glutamate synthesis protein (capsule biosynthesis protein)